MRIVGEGGSHRLGVFAGVHKKGGEKIRFLFYLRLMLKPLSTTCLLRFAILPINFGQNRDKALRLWGEETPFAQYQPIATLREVLIEGDVGELFVAC